MRRQMYKTVMVSMVCSLCMATTLCSARETEAPEQTMLDNLLTAIQQNDYLAFLQDATPKVKAGLTKRVFAGVRSQFAPRMQQGYELSYLGSLKQKGCEVQLWKVTYRDKQDDTLAKLALQDGKLAGFWLQ